MFESPSGKELEPEAGEAEFREDFVRHRTQAVGLGSRAGRRASLRLPLQPHYARSLQINSTEGNLTEAISQVYKEIHYDKIIHLDTTQRMFRRWLR